ncbi:MAG: V-type ATPase subunit [Candidatus Thermoplasmatota archaeon]
MALQLLRRGPSNFPYAVARVAAKRAKLLDDLDYAKALQMDVPEITLFIQESAYKAEVDELSTKFSGLDLLEAALTVNEERTYESIRSMVGGEAGALIALFLDRYHVADLKTLLRGKASGATRAELLREMVLENQATYDLFAPLLGDDVKSVTDVTTALANQGGQAKAWAATLQKVPAGSPLSRYEDALDKAYFHSLLTGLEASGAKGVTVVLEFARREVDNRNILNAARWVAANETGDFTPFIIPGGRSLSVADLLTLSRSKSLAGFAEALGATKLKGLQEGVEAAAKSGRLGPFQAAVWRNHLAALDRLGHTNPLSLVPILMFLVRKHREVTTLRAIARGKAAGLSTERLKELIV